MASLTPTFIQHFKCGELHILLPFLMLKNAFKKYPPQNRTNVQIKGGGGQRPFEQCSKKHHFSPVMASLTIDVTPHVPDVKTYLGKVGWGNSHWNRRS